MALMEELIIDLETELKESDPKFNRSLLLSKVKKAVREVEVARKYPSNYTEEQIGRDMMNYYSNCRDIALYDYNMIGIDFSKSHSESGDSTSYVDREKLFKGIVPIARI